MNKVYPDAKSALDGILKDGMMIMSGGFGLCGIADGDCSLYRSAVENSAGPTGGGAASTAFGPIQAENS